ncbi:oxygen-independent coproporphyrinogen III oxidase [Chitinophaga niabensis]|uniref:Coproporphyrinogen-III oxidase n=1 Tax=Chitinophaga niabensis TaxID=536979 RepID=A0A1N6KD30_9BACT|nr:oxygen-independent coproporphyrinogen III oxidase [Chitinophaga niabensis]SIO54450.1 oxygen-independent coproporphyrinogen-3 oxidase [Chitinophaga niabensis]
MQLIEKYNIPVPRYTSYPTVPYWNSTSFSEEQFKAGIRDTEEGISLYIHLPFCESLCTYCGCNKYITVNHGYESPYIDTLLKEWQLYRALFKYPPKIREVHLGGGTPTFFSASHLSHLLQAIFSSCEIMPDAAMSFEGHPNNTTLEHLQTLYALGFRRLSLGIQDFDPVVQKVINRVQPFCTVEKVVREARRIGYTSINFDLIYGLPLQTSESISSTITQVMQLYPERIAFYSYAHVPWIKGNGQRLFSEKDLPKDAAKRALYELGRSMLQEYFYEEIGMDHFALPDDELNLARQNGSLHRNFMGYTVTHTSLLIGLGVSAISDTGHAYAQNEKQLALYRQRVQEGNLPLFRGHILSREDRLLRQHIEELMCYHETRWYKVPECLPRLEEMEREGLVYIEPGRLTVTEKGTPFIRNICMAFDAHLWRNLPQKTLFSSGI